MTKNQRKLRAALLSSRKNKRGVTFGQWVYPFGIKPDAWAYAAWARGDDPYVYSRRG